jgi:Tol biopolymer transport system component
MLVVPQYEVDSASDGRPRFADVWPSFAHDGQSIVFTRQFRGGRFQLWRLDLETGKTSEVGSASTDRSRPCCQRDGPLIAFCERRLWGVSSTIGILREGDAHFRQRAGGRLDVFSGARWYPSWAPHGRQLVCLQVPLFRSGGGGVLIQIDLETQSVTTLTSRNEIFAGKPSMSPREDLVAFAGQKNSGQPYDERRNQIWLCSLQGKYWPLDAHQGRAPEWSPDGSLIAFASNRGNDENGRYALFTEPGAGGTAVQVTPYSWNAQHPSWSPDGRRLACDAVPEGQLHRRIVIVDM